MYIRMEILGFIKFQEIWGSSNIVQFVLGSGEFLVVGQIRGDIGFVVYGIMYVVQQWVLKFGFLYWQDDQFGGCICNVIDGWGGVCDFVVFNVVLYQKVILSLYLCQGLVVFEFKIDEVLCQCSLIEDEKGVKGKVFQEVVEGVYID